MEISELAGLLQETAEHHDRYEKTHAAHNWWDWYAAYMHARQGGASAGAGGAGCRRLHGRDVPRGCALTAGGR